jgi:hypothetical protein
VFEERDDLIDAIARELRSIPVADEAAKARIVAAVRHEVPRGRLAAAWQWLRAPRVVRVTPLGGLAFGAVAVTVIALLAWGDRAAPRTPAAPVAASAPANATLTASRPVGSPKVVQFVLVAPSASHVSLVGDFNGWDARATPLTAAAARGVWAVEVPLAPGRHAYAFIVDDSTWMADPAAARAPGDDFGAPNSVIVVDGAGGAI